jgi:16S rRNA (cytosine1402-N4)-methyltransferase
MQLDQSHRGFSFQKEGPLDMRMNPSVGVSAKEIVNKLSEKELGLIIRDLGEEPRWKIYAKAIVEARRRKRIETTKDLADIILAAFKGKYHKLHPATLVFQALRIYVNKELESVEEGLRKALELVAPHGKIGAISFHSLEDRIVKNVFKEAASPTKNERGQETRSSLFKLLTRKPVAPSPEEVKRNPRSRSAKLRFIGKL